MDENLVGTAEDSGEFVVSVVAGAEAHSAVIALVGQSEFTWAQIVIPDFQEFSSHEEWMLSREGYQIGLEMAGVAVEMVEVGVGPFLTWCRNQKIMPSRRALESFAWTLSKATRESLASAS